MFIYALLAIQYVITRSIVCLFCHSSCFQKTGSYDLGRPFSHRERPSYFLHRVPAWPDVSHSHELLHPSSTKVASHGLRWLDRWLWTSWFRRFAFRDWSACFQVRNRLIATFVSHHITASSRPLLIFAVSSSVVSMMSTMVVLWAFVPRVRRVD